jgi:hypothetical protein
MYLNIPYFEFSLKRQFHCLRHFSFHNLEQVNFLHNNFSCFHPQEIKEQLEMVGSKFNKEFAQQPIDILNSLVKASFTQREIGNNKILLQLSFSSKDFPYGIGNSALISLSELSVQQQAAKYKVNRSNYEVWTCEVAELPTTNLLSIIALKQENTLQMVTLFPGDYAPAFPKGKCDSEEMNRVFWEGHCLLQSRFLT